MLLTLLLLCRVLAKPPTPSAVLSRCTVHRVPEASVPGTHWVETLTSPGVFESELKLVASEI